MRGEVKQA